ncbi:unnamed protein product [Microthlaspi erraticum]|uniref:Reverse transcriptase zinc-binding domain-containing protein n=1 Tax=Microthlaspi erraticum TaxID=1685480 RepID=A0A6D2JV43_9BRAS|nr:unnamed protein product [Microthlaspi erraticum]
MADLFLPRSKTWNKALIREILPGYEKEILSIIPGTFDSEDRLMWLPNVTGEYSVRTYYTARALAGALPVGENLAARGLLVQSRCIHCGEAETTIHLLFHCRFAKSVWRWAPFRDHFKPNLVTSIKDGISKLKVLISLPPIGIKAGSLAPWILWSIWLSRNNKIFNNKSNCAFETMNLAVIRAREWIEAQGYSPKMKKSGFRPSRQFLPLDCV